MCLVEYSERAMFSGLLCMIVQLLSHTKAAGLESKEARAKYSPCFTHHACADWNRAVSMQSGQGYHPDLHKGAV